MTNDELIKHRLAELERLGEGWLEAQRRMDTLALSQAAIEKSVAAIEKSLERNAASMERLHQRLDETLREQAHEDGRELGRAEVRAEAVEEGRKAGLVEGKDQAHKTTWKVVGVTASVLIAFGALVVATLTIAGVG